MDTLVIPSNGFIRVKYKKKSRSLVIHSLFNSNFPLVTPLITKQHKLKVSGIDKSAHQTQFNQLNPVVFARKNCPHL
jgi:hypothetical protein